MTVSLRIVRAGPGCTLQDEGRRGYLRFGVTTAGPMDWIAHAEARLLAGNDVHGAAIEIGPGGLEAVAVGGAVRLGISADGFKVTVGAETLAAGCAVTLPEGERVSVIPGRTHLWGYIAWAGETTLAPVMGSLSMHLRSGVGPMDGKALAAGGIIPLRARTGADDLPALEWLREPRPIGGALRFVPGPQADYFTPEGFQQFCATEYRVTSRSDRMGYRLEGPVVTHARGHDIVSDGIAMGAIQIPGDGQPIVLMADRQPTGGYPKIGTVIRADQPRLAQARPGTALRFEPVSIDVAVAALKAAIPSRAAIEAGARRRGGLDLEILSSGNYASGMIDAIGHGHDDQVP